MNAGKTKARPVRAGARAAIAILLFCWTMSGFAGEKAPNTASAACRQGTTNPADRKPCHGKTGMKTPVTTPVQTPRQDPGPGAVVWLDSEQMIYYCADDPKFGKTKQGYLIPEEHAKARRGRAFQGKTCS